MNLVAGLGVSGVSVIKYLASINEPLIAFNPNPQVDLTKLEAEFPQVKFYKEKLPSKQAKKVGRVIISPGISLQTPWVQKFKQDGVEVIGDLELFARAANKPIIAITGSNGKTSVTTLVADFLAEAGLQVGVGGNIGRPALDLLLDETEFDIFVLELSSFQLETTFSLHSLSSSVLNISADHQDRYSSMQAYIQAKLSVFDDTAMAVLPSDTEHPLRVNAKIPQVFFGLDAPISDRHYGLVELDNQTWLGRGGEAWIPVNQLKLQAPHHLLNALAAMALCEPFDLLPQTFARVLQGFSGLEHRTQLVAEQDGVAWINDSKATNTGAVLAALSSLGAAEVAKNNPEKSIVLLAGGQAKGADLSPLTEGLSRFVTHLIAFGEDADLLIEVAENVCETHKVADLAEAVALASKCVAESKIVLLSPACASLDQFKNYEERGQAFIDLVNQELGLDV